MIRDISSLESLMLRILTGELVWTPLRGRNNIKQILETGSEVAWTGNQINLRNWGRRWVWYKCYLKHRVGKHSGRSWHTIAKDILYFIRIVSKERVKYEGGCSQLRKMQAEVPQVSILGQFLYVLFTSNISEVAGRTMTTFADGTGMLPVARSESKAKHKLQKALTSVWE